MKFLSHNKSRSGGLGISLQLGKGLIWLIMINSQVNVNVTVNMMQNKQNYANIYKKTNKYIEVHIHI